MPHTGKSADYKETPGHRRPKAMASKDKKAAFAMMVNHAKGKGTDKVGKVMGEYKRGELHSGSKSGPQVKDRKQAMAIAMSERRKAMRK